MKETYSYLRGRVATQCKHLKISFPSQFSTSPNKVRKYTFDKMSPAPPPLTVLCTFLFFAIGDEEESIGSKSKEITWHNSRREWLLSIGDYISQILIRQLLRELSR